MATKPTIADARWATDGGAQLTAPSSGLQDSGFVDGTDLIPDYANHLHKEAYKWAQYLDDGLLSGAFGLVTAISPTAIGGAVDDYAPTSHATAAVIRLDLSADATISGLAGGAAGRIVTLVNIDGVFDVFLTHNATSTAANRFSLPHSRGYRLRPGCAATFRYDATTSLWHLIGGTGKTQQTMIVAGAAFEPLTETSDFTNTSSGEMALNGVGMVTLYPLEMPIGSVVSTVDVVTRTSSTGGDRELQLNYTAWDDNGAGFANVASDTDSTISSTVTLSATANHQIVTDRRYYVSLSSKLDDTIRAMKIVFYPA